MKHTTHLRSVIVSTMTSLIASGIFTPSTAAAAESLPSKPCYGIAKAGQNACMTPRHGCSSLATKDKDPEEWIEVPADSCKAQGGSLTPPPAGRAPG